MSRDDRDHYDIIDEDLYEEFDDEELYELVEAERQKALQRARDEKNEPKTKRPFPKWAFWLIACAMVLNLVALLPKTFSIAAFDFLKTSAVLSTQDDINDYKQAVVVVGTEDGRGTGFAISESGTVITNHHVVEDENRVTVAFPEEGLFNAHVEAVYPEVDLAVLQVDAPDERLPSLQLANKTTFKQDQAIYFIGNPLRFQGIANEGHIIGYTELSSWNEPVLMVDAPIYHGNSGSPVITKDGKVIGVVFATLKHDIHGKVGLVIPIDYYYERHVK
ncbi:S1C family serine protease [Lentibacillus saliphilus]|uniref:S1C family serine protease n=1 Tax=Lentibacillus saliphilus TaxID=2737028 RepID=UPI001C2F20BE|nr:serine protease [Lentibacillus saliphilus]